MGLLMPCLNLLFAFVYFFACCVLPVIFSVQFGTGTRTESTISSGSFKLRSKRCDWRWMENR